MVENIRFGIRTAWIGLFLCAATGIGFHACSTKRETGLRQAGSAGESWSLAPFDKREEFFPVLKSDTTTFYCPVNRSRVKWQESYVFNPAAVVRNGRVYLLFRAEDKIGGHGGTSRIGIAESDDGFHFTKFSRPVIYPDNDAFRMYEKEGGCEDPRIVESGDGTYVMTYTAFDGSLARLCVATSKDLVAWKKHGLAFGKAKNGNYANLWSKSGAVVCRRIEDRMVAVKINGRYWMYWGETDIYLAVSDNLIDWEPVLKEEKTGKRLEAYLGNGQYDVRFAASRIFYKTAVSIREGRFDSGLVEPGPPALLTDRGILFIYNGSNDGAKGDPGLKPGEYTVGQAMFDARDPSAVIGRCETPFLRAERENETSGQMENTAFVEALIHFEGKWFIYYTMAEAGIGAAICDRKLD